MTTTKISRRVLMWCSYWKSSRGAWETVNHVTLSWHSRDTQLTHTWHTSDTAYSVTEWERMPWVVPYLYTGCLSVYKVPRILLGWPCFQISARKEKHLQHCTWKWPELEVYRCCKSKKAKHDNSAGSEPLPHEHDESHRRFAFFFEKPGGSSSILKVSLERNFMRIRPLGVVVYIKKL